MINVREALDLILREVPRLGSEQVSLPEARGRVLAEVVLAPRDVPPFRNAAMDGYAVRAADVGEASLERSVRLQVLETVAAGMVPEREVEAGCATRIMTGALMPEGADAVVRVEDTDNGDEVVEIRAAVPSGESVRFPGEDLRAGEGVFEPGRLLRPADVGALASLGVTTVPVVRKPRVSILATGDELVEAAQPLKPGKIVNSNAYSLAAAVEEAGGIPVVPGIVPDDPERMRDAFREAFDSSDLVLSTGGVSVGTFDYVRKILSEIGCEERFWKVAQRPGKPLTFGLREGTPALGLPGNPVSSLVCFYVYVRPLLRTMLGFEQVHLPTAPATLTERVRKAAGLTEFVRCTLEGPPDDLRARSTGTQSSGVLRSLSVGDALIVTPQEPAVLEEGTRVRVILLRPDAGSVAPPF